MIFKLWEVPRVNDPTLLIEGRYRLRPGDFSAAGMNQADVCCRINGSKHLFNQSTTLIGFSDNRVRLATSVAADRSAGPGIR